MTSYLLLRNNKETGPYSLDEIVQFGLKAYDLIWVNGKSAAWRYPGEIPELEPYAPIVEEQPYDRFYKKGTDEKKEAEPQQQTEVREVKAVKQVTAPIQTETPVVAIPAATPVSTPIIEVPAATIVEEIIPAQQTPIEAPPVTTPRADTTPVAKKSVFVTMPKGSAPAQPVAAAMVAATPTPGPSAPVATPVQSQPAAFEKYMPASKPATAPAEPVMPAKTITITENPVTAEIKYSQPLDEIKEMYVKTLQERKQRIANKAFILQTVKKVAVVIAIVGAGILIGFTMKSNAGKKLVAASETTEQPTNPSVVDDTNAVEHSTTIDQASEETVPSANATEHEESYKASPQVNSASTELREPVRNAKVAEQKTVEAPATQKAIMPEPVSPDLRTKEVLAEVPPQNTEVNERGERTRKVRSTTPTEEVATSETQTETTNEKPVAPKSESKPVVNKSLLSQVSVKSNNYQIVAFGGIRDLQLTLYNDSKYVLDKVLVELQYLKPTEEPLRIDVITFKSVSPNGSLTIRMPDTNRGIKVRYRILNILSTQSARDMADL